MRPLQMLSYCIALLAAFAASGFAQQVQTDFDKHVSFAQYKTYSWKKVEVSNTLWESRIKDAVDGQLTAKGWKQVDDDGDIVIVAIGTSNIQKSLETFYNGLGGGGWRWRGFGGYGTSTTTERDYKEGTLVVDMFDAKSRQLVWRGNAEDMLSGDPEKNEKKLNKAVAKLFKKFPPQSKG